MQVWIKCPQFHWIGVWTTQVSKNSCMNMQASVQRCKEAKKTKWVAQSKQDKHSNITQSRERCVSSTPTPWKCILQVVTSEQALGETNATTQEQAHEEHKAWQSLDLERLTLT